jgi:Cys-rich four helix bundle protein (predicted Tat secretion target)
MNRRDVLIQGATAVASIAATTLFSQAASAAEAKKAPAAGGSLRDQVINAANDCVKTGLACIAMCEEELAKGNTKMALCSKRVHDLIATCEATLQLVSFKSDLAVKMALLCAESCKSCHAACAEHKEHFAHGMHLECKACMDSCSECEKACRAFAA